jgi:hypothetical protein
MPVQIFPDGLEPDDAEAVVWRLMDIGKFRDLITTSELYFRRADLFSDDNEGLPPEQYMPYADLNPLDVRDALQLNHHRGSLAQDREGFFTNCWCLSPEPTIRMWQEYARDGLAVASRYSLLKHALGSCESTLGALLGLVRYGSKHLTGWNVLRFISTKREQFAHEQEVRALLWAPDEFAGGNRHFDHNNFPHDRPLTSPSPDRVPKGLRRAINLRSLITHIEVSPWASESTFAQTERLAREYGCSIPVRWSALSRFKDLIATDQDLHELLRTQGDEIYSSD